MSEHEIPVYAEHERQKGQESPGTTGHIKPNHKANTGAPRWVIGFVIFFVILILVLIIMHLTGNGFSNHMGMSMSILEYRVHQL